jgi:hypothetical protein
VHEEAAQAYAAWLENYKKKQEGRGKKRKVNYDKMSDANKERVKEAVLASMGIRTNPDNPSTGSPSLPSKKPLIFVINVPVLSLSTPSRAIMPAPIMSNFPHICLQLGSTLDCADCPILRCVVDTAAALTTDNFHFVATLAKKYPHCVAKLYVPEDYNPIVLSGIVQGRGESVMMELTVGFQFHLLYKTCNGQDTSISLPLVPTSQLIPSSDCLSSKPPV